MWAQVKKFSPLAMLAAFVLVYLPKGFGQFLVDIQSLTIDKLQAKWQNIAMAIGAGVVLMLVKRLKLGPEMTAIVSLVLYFVIGYNIAKVIDPPYYGARAGNAQYVPPAQMNPYAHGAD